MNPTKSEAPAANAGSPRGASHRKRNRRITFVVLGLIVAGLVAVALVPARSPVDLVRVRRADLRMTVDEDGVTRVKDRYVVSAPLAGSLARIELHAGDLIREGDVIARVLPSTAPLLDARTRSELGARLSATEAGIRQAESTVARARTAAEFAEREARRSRALATQGSLPAQQLDRIEADARARREELASAEFGVRIARHERTMAAVASGERAATTTDDPSYEVRSPITGRVLRVLRPSDGPVVPGTPLLEIGDPAALEIVVDVLTSDAVRIRPGARVILDRWGGDQPLEGRVRLVEPSAFTRVSALGVEEQRVNVVIELVSANAAWSALGDGYRVESAIVVDEVRGALSVPELALFRDGDRLGVFAVRDGVARRVEVRVGRRNGLDAEIVGGIGEGAQVILHPSDRITDGLRVEAR